MKTGFTTHYADYRQRQRMGTMISREKLASLQNNEWKITVGDKSDDWGAIIIVQL